MATRKKAPAKSARPRKRSPRSIEKAIRTTETKVHAAVHAVLRKAGLPGVKVHSIHYAVDPNVMTASGCQNCDLATHTCVQSPNGWVCVPN